MDGLLTKTVVESCVEIKLVSLIKGFPHGSEGKASACDAEDLGLTPGPGRSHSSTLAWKISWTEKPDRLQSMESQRVGHD